MKTDIFNTKQKATQVSSPFLQQQRGVGLIEVMVAILLLAMGLLGAVALQFATAKEQRSSQYVARAALLGNEMAERMRSNRAGVEAGLYNMQATNSHTYAVSNQIITNNSFVPFDCTPVPNCINPLWVADRDVLNWGRSGLVSLPQVAAIVLPVPNMSNARDIVLAWVEPVVDKKSDGTLLVLSQAAGNNGCPALIGAPPGVRCYQVRFVL